MAYPRYNNYEQGVPPVQPAAYYSTPSTSALPSREPLSREPHRVLFAGLPPDITASDLRVSLLPVFEQIVSDVVPILFRTFSSQNLCISHPSQHLLRAFTAKMEIFKG